MENEADKSKERKDKIKNWLSDYQNLLLVGILVFAFIIRIYFFIITKSQPLWWDEAAYGSLAKNFILGGAWNDTYLIQHETFIRPILFPLLWAALLKIGFKEVGVRFVLEFFPSMVAVFFVYLISKELYGKKIALISAFLFSIVWVHLFYTARLLADVSSLVFIFPSIYYFIKSQKEEFNARYFAVSLLLLSLSTLMRYPVGLIFFSYLIFMILTKKINLVKKKNFWISGLIGILPILIFFLINFINSGSVFPQLLSGEYYGKDTGQLKPPIAFNTLNQIPNFLGGPGCSFTDLTCYLKTPLLLFFIIGAALLLFELGFSYDLINKKQKIKSHLLVLLLFGVFYSFFIFSVRAAEDRYFLPISITFVLVAALGGSWVYSAIEKYSKQIALLVLLAILCFGAYQEINYANSIIKDKQESFLYERKGFEWIKSNLPQDSVLLGRGTGPYAVYYSEMQFIDTPIEENQTFLQDLKNIKVDYFVFNAYRPEREYFLNYLQENQDNWQPINAFFFDEQQQQPAFVIYKHIY